MTKQYISAAQLQQVSFQLAGKIIDSGYQPSFLIGVWRGGSPIAITVHEVLEFCGLSCNHIPVRISAYKDIEQQANSIRIADLHYLQQHISDKDRLLIVDDVHDTGLSLQKLLTAIKKIATPRQIKIATAYFKPANNQVDFRPDYHIEESENWLVFPHELCGLSQQELCDAKPDINNIKRLLLERAKVVRKREY